MRSARIAIGTAVWISAAAGAAATWLPSCGGSDEGIPHGGDASATDGGGADSTVLDAPATGDDGGGDRGRDGAVDAGSCAPPSDPAKAALCVTLTAETVQFLPNVPAFDGKGVLLVAVQASANPDGGPTLGSPAILPDLDAGGDAGLVDLSGPLPSVRIDGLPPSTVYPQALFIDDPGAGLKTPKAGWWLGGYDLSNGLQDAPLKPVTLQAGTSTTVSIDLRALRALSLQVSTSVTPAGNGQGPLQVLVIEGHSVAPEAGARAWGFGTAACADCVADGGAKAIAFFIGSGPYYTVPILDDFGLGGSFPPGAMTSLDVEAGLVVPAANEFSAGNAYVFSQSVKLNYVNQAPDGAIDDASCP
jgi:hypothetical protein